MKKLISFLFVVLSFSLYAQNHGNNLNKVRTFVDLDSDVTNLASATRIDSSFFQNIVRAMENRIYNDQDFNTLSGALDTVTTDTAALGITKRWYVATQGDTTIGGQGALVFGPGGKFNNASGSILTINMPIEAGLYQIFEGNIDSIRIGKQTSSIYPEWFGAVGDQSNDDTAALQAAILAVGSGFNANNHEIILTRRYKITDSLGINNSNLRLKGLSSANYRSAPPFAYNSPLIDAATVPTDKNIFNIRGNGADGNTVVTLENFRVDGHNTAGGTGAVIYAHSLRSLQLDRIMLYRSTLNGINVDGTQGRIYEIYITDSSIRQEGGSFSYTGTGLIDSAGVNSLHILRSIITLFERNIYHKDNSANPTSLGPWRFYESFFTSAGEEAVRIEDRTDNQFVACSFELGSQTNEDAATFALIRGSGFITSSYFSEETQIDTGLVFADSCIGLYITNSHFNNGNGDANIRIAGGDRISITGCQFTNGGGAGIKIGPAAGGTDPTRLVITNNWIGATGVGIETSGLTGKLSGCVIMGNTYAGGVNDLATESDFDASCLILNAINRGANSDYDVPYFHNGLAINNNLGIGIEPDSAHAIELILGTTVPQLVWYDEDGTSNNKQWQIIANGGSFRLEKVNDAFSQATQWLQVFATGTTIDSLDIPNGGVKIGDVNSQGAGTLNAEAVYDNGVILTDYVFEKDYRDKMPTIAQVEAFYENNKHLPTIMGRDDWKLRGAPSMGSLINQLWETIEVQQIYISEINDRLDSLAKAVLGGKD